MLCLNSDASFPLLLTIASESDRLELVSRVLYFPLRIVLGGPLGGLIQLQTKDHPSIAELKPDSNWEQYLWVLSNFIFVLFRG